jgi:hypothetical protein
MRGNLSIIIIAAEESGMEANVMYNDTSWIRLSIIKTAHAIHLLKTIFIRPKANALCIFDYQLQFPKKSQSFLSLLSSIYFYSLLWFYVVSRATALTILFLIKAIEKFHLWMNITSHNILYTPYYLIMIFKNG